MTASLLRKAILLSFLACMMAYMWPFLADDALISLRYAARLAAGKGLTWNDAGPPVEGYSNLLWVLLCAGLHSAGVPIVLAARILGIACSLLCVHGVLRLIARATQDNTAQWVGGLVVALSAPLAIWGIGGLEQPLLLLLLLLAMAQLAPAFEANILPTAKQSTCAGILLGLACLTRPDTPLWVAAVAATIVWQYGFAAPSLRVALLLSGVAAAFWAGQLLFREAYYHSLWPNTAYAKIAFTPARCLEGAKYLVRFGIDHCIFGVIAVAQLLVWYRKKTIPPIAVLWLVPTVVWATYLVAIGGDIFPGFRHGILLLPLLALLTAFGTGLRPTGNSRIPIAAGVAGIAGLYILLQLHGSQDNIRAREEHWEWRGQTIGTQLARTFGATKPLIALNPAGCIPFWYGHDCLDMLGLNDAYIARHRPADMGQGWLGHELGDGAYVLARQPDMLMLSGIGIDDMYFPGDVFLLNSPVFRQEYVPATFHFAPQTRDCDNHPVQWDFISLKSAPVACDTFHAIFWMRHQSPSIGVVQQETAISVPVYLLRSKDRPIDIHFARDTPTLSLAPNDTLFTPPLFVRAGAKIHMENTAIRLVGAPHGGFFPRDTTVVLGISHQQPQAMLLGEAIDLRLGK